MKEIYIVTTGDYSDYGIVGVFSTEEKAEQFREVADRPYMRASVEVFTVDEFVGIPKGQRAYRVWMDMMGNVLRVFETDITSPFDTQYMRLKDGTHNMWMFAKDEDHAIKIAADRWAQMKYEETKNED